MKTNELTYPERAGLAVKELRDVCVKAAETKWNDAKKDAEEIIELKISALNKLRGAGMDLNEASGRGQLTFNDNGKMFVRTEIVTLTDGMSLRDIQICTHVAAVVKEPIQTREELALYEAELEPFFNAAFGISKKPRKLEPSPVKSWYNSLVDKVADFKCVWKLMNEQQPVTTWDVERTRKYLETVKPLEEKNQEVRKHLAELEAA